MQHDSTTTSRNTRRRLADDYDSENDRMLPPATQLEKAREAYQNSISNSGYEPGNGWIIIIFYFCCWNMSKK